MELIETVTVGSGGQASITFASIAADYTDLKLVVSARTNRTSNAEDSLVLTFNGVTTGYSLMSLYGNGSTEAASSYTADGAFRLVAATNYATANTFGNSELYIPNYASSVAKSFSMDAVSENNATEAWQFITAGLWSNTAAITSITLDPLVGTTILEHSTASLYGILAGSDGTTTVT
jgi:hypothetical protein